MKLTVLIAILAVGALLYTCTAQRTQAAARSLSEAASPQPDTERLQPISVSSVPDQPVPFGFKMSWLAVADADPERIASLLQLDEIQPSNWESDIGRVYQDASTVFISPPIGRWTLVVAFGLPDLGHEPDRQRWEALFTGLARKFPEVQYFASHPVVEYHA